MQGQNFMVFRKSAPFGRISTFRFLIAAHLCARGPAPQLLRSATDVRPTSLASTKEAGRWLCAATTGEQDRGRKYALR